MNQDVIKISKSLLLLLLKVKGYLKKDATIYMIFIDPSFQIFSPHNSSKSPQIWIDKNHVKIPISFAFSNKGTSKERSDRLQRYILRYKFFKTRGLWTFISSQKMTILKSLFLLLFPKLPRNKKFCLKNLSADVWKIYQ